MRFGSNNFPIKGLSETQIKQLLTNYQSVHIPYFKGAINNKFFGFSAEIGCTKDSDCPSQTACVSEQCVNPCSLSEPCGLNALCSVLDTLPVRTMTCVCIQGYEGDASVECTPGKQTD